MKLNPTHSWDVSPADARGIQERLRWRVSAEGGPAPEDVRFVAGTDISVGNKERPGRAAVVVIEYPSLEPIEQSVVEGRPAFPYVPGLLSFREIPLLAPAFERLESTPDLVVVDGHGVAHPRRFGLASHLGMLLGVPTIGCAKSRLVGSFDEPADETDAVSPLYDGEQLIGQVVRTRIGMRPIFVSVGDHIGLKQATEWVLRLTRGFRLPEPTRLADQAAAGRKIVDRKEGQPWKS